MLSATVSRQWLDYLEDQFEFCEKIGNELRKNLIVRLYQHDYGWNQKERWKDKLGERYHFGKIANYKKLREAGAGTKTIWYKTRDQSAAGSITVMKLF